MKRKSMSKPGKFHHQHPVIFLHQWSCFTAVMSERLVVLRPQRDQNWLTFLTIFLKLANWGCLKMRIQFQQVQRVCYCFSISLGKFWAWDRSLKIVKFESPSHQLNQTHSKTVLAQTFSKLLQIKVLFSKGWGFRQPNSGSQPKKKTHLLGHSDPWKTSTENHVPKKCLSKPWIFFEKSFDSAPKMMSQTTESHFKKSLQWLGKKKQWNWKEKPMQIPIISSLKIANWFPGDLKSPEFDLRKRGKQQGCLYSLFSSWTSMYRQPIVRKIPPNYVRNVHTALHAWCGFDWCSEHLSSWTWKILTGLFCPVPGMLPHHCLWVWAVSICLVAPW